MLVWWFHNILMDPGSTLIFGHGPHPHGFPDGYWSSSHHILIPQQRERSWESGTCQLNQLFKRVLLESLPIHLLGKVVFIWDQWHLCSGRGSVKKANEGMGKGKAHRSLPRIQMMLWGVPYNSTTWGSVNAGSKPESCVVLIPCLGRSHSSHPSLWKITRAEWNVLNSGCPKGWTPLQIRFNVLLCLVAERITMGIQLPSVMWGQNPHPPGGFQSPRESTNAPQESRRGRPSPLPTAPRTAHHEQLSICPCTIILAKFL